jgi:hypothetical protein
MVMGMLAIWSAEKRSFWNFSRAVNILNLFFDLSFLAQEIYIG